jgi:hypothetical protein
MSAETPEEFWYANIAKYRSTPDPVGTFPFNVAVEVLTKTKKTEICVFEGYLKNGDSLLLTYPRNASMGGTLVVKNFIGMGVGDCDYTAQTNVDVYNLDYNQPMTDEFFLSLLEDSYGWEIKDYGDLSIY